MPMNRKLYPDNWEEIALAVKNEADWHCEECGKSCWRPGEVSSASIKADRSTWAKFTLTVAHLDHQPSNCDRSNLKALCAPCHCRYDLAAMAQKKRLKAERQGQLRLEGV